MPSSSTCRGASIACAELRLVLLALETSECVIERFVRGSMLGGHACSESTIVLVRDGVAAWRGRREQFG